MNALSINHYFGELLHPIKKKLWITTCSSDACSCINWRKILIINFLYLPYYVTRLLYSRIKITYVRTFGMKIILPWKFCISTLLTYYTKYSLSLNCQKWKIRFWILNFFSSYCLPSKSGPLAGVSSSGQHPNSVFSHWTQCTSSLGPVIIK